MKYMRERCRDGRLAEPALFCRSPGEPQALSEAEGEVEGAVEGSRPEPSSAMTTEI